MRVYVDKNSNVEANKTEIFDQCLCVKCKIEIKQNVIVNLSSMKYFSFLASFGKLAYLDLSNKPL